MLSQEAAAFMVMLSREGSLTFAAHELLQRRTRPLFPFAIRTFLGSNLSQKGEEKGNKKWICGYEENSEGQGAARRGEARMSSVCAVGWQVVARVPGLSTLCVLRCI